MKKHISNSIVLFLVMILFSSCELVEGIFKAGMGVGIFLVLLVIALIVWLISRFRK